MLLSSSGDRGGSRCSPPPLSSCRHTCPEMPLLLFPFSRLPAFSFSHFTVIARARLPGSSYRQTPTTWRGSFVGRDCPRSPGLLVMAMAVCAPHSSHALALTRIDARLLQRFVRRGYLPRYLDEYLSTYPAQKRGKGTLADGW